MCGSFGEVPQHRHLLRAIMADSRARVAGVDRGRRGVMGGDVSEKALAISALRRRLGVANVRAQNLRSSKIIYLSSVKFLQFK